MMLSSPAIPPDGEIPVQYTCDAGDIAPPLAWSGVPNGAQSLVLVVEDPDAPGGVFMHWAAYDIAPGIKGLVAGPHPYLREAQNDFGKSGYGGPCPPQGTSHHYHFQLLALNRANLDLGPAPTATEVLRAAEPYAIDRAEFVATYRRKEPKRPGDSP
jgi:Raf kinase inhibitor-like YbhB/YbcL family protein